MNALTVVQPQHQALAAPAFTMGEMERVALAIAKGGLFGSNDPNAVLTLCMLAQAEGKHPALIMQNYHIIKGKPAKKAEAMLVDFLSSGGRVEWHQLDDTCADATFSHPAGGSVRINWDSERVKTAGLGGNDMHRKFPRQMLRSRCISEGVRTVFPGATSGLYVPEEVQEFEEHPPRAAAPVRDVTPPRREEPKPALPSAHDAVDAMFNGDAEEVPFTGEESLSTRAFAFEAEMKAAATSEDLVAIWNGAKALRADIKREDPNMLTALTKTRDYRASELAPAEGE